MPPKPTAPSAPPLSEGTSPPPVIALSLGVGSVLLAVACAALGLFYAHAGVQREAEHDFLTQARLLAAAADETAGDDPAHAVETIARMWADVGSHHRDKYICVVDADAKLLLHTGNPDTVGASVGRNRLPGCGADVCELGAFARGGIDYVGTYISSAGEAQVAAFASAPRKGLLIGVHRSKAALAAEMWALIGPAALAFLLVCLWLIPMTLWLLYAAIRSSLRRRREVELALAVSEAHHRLLAENTPDCLFRCDRSMCITYLNPAATTLFGRPPDELVGQMLPDLIGPADRAAVREAVERLSDGSDPESGARLEARICDVGGRELPVEIHVWIVWSQSGEQGYQGTVRDISDRKAAERDRDEMAERLRQAQKLEAIGQLAGGVAHDFNNLLTTIGGNADLLSSSVEPGSEDAELLEDITRASAQAADLTRQLLTFARRGKSEQRPLRINAVVQEVVRLLSRSIDKGISVVVELCPDDPTVHGDDAQLQSALLNLGLNARDAMPDGGELRFQTHIVEMDGARHVDVVVADTGVGMDEESRNRVFEPFFTTKEVGRGTGLGLAAVYGCAKSHGGTVQVSSEPGEGSVFTVRLPCVDCGPREVRKSGRGVRGRGHVLIVDDEEMVRAYLAKALRRLGYEVTLCGSGAEAVALVQDGGPMFDVALVDVVMPGMNGVDTFRALNAARPQMPVLLASGYSRGAAIDELLAEGLTDFLSKPLRIEPLSEAIAAAVGGADA